MCTQSQQKKLTVWVSSPQLKLSLTHETCHLVPFLSLGWLIKPHFRYVNSIENENFHQDYKG